MLKMYPKLLLWIGLLLTIQELLVQSCLITNCPRGGKRNGKASFADTIIKSCVSCGPNRSGQCFGPNTCCGPFGCLLGTPETLVCKRDGYFHELEPCIAGSKPCKKNTGRCAADNICCNQDWCQLDKMCTSEDKLLHGSSNIPTLELFNLMNYQNQPEYISD